MKLELENLSPYLPYKLMCNVMGEFVDDFDEPLIPKIFEIVGLGTDYVETHEYKRTITEQTVWSDVFPILRPLSDLIKIVDIDGKKIVPIEGMFLPCGERDVLTSWAKENKCWLGQQISYLVYCNLFQLHFDVFNLIENKLAIDINNVNFKNK